MGKKKPIISPFGQWAYPGEITIIPSSDITMKGVNYPVLGIDNLGNQQMMIPGGEYTFPGDYVTEIPQMGKGGLRQWFAEEWTDVKTGKPCGRSGKDKDGRPYPACRPSKRVNETTPKTTSEMSSAEKAKFKREKTSGKRIDYNHKRREFGGESWLDQYQDGAQVPSNIERMSPVNINLKRKKVSDSPEYQYDDKGNLLYTFPLRNYARGEIGSSYIPIKNVNPTLEEFINVASPYYPIDNKLVSDPKINLEASNYQQSLEEEYILPEFVGKSFGNLPIVKDDGYSPNRRWVSNLRAKDTGAYYGKDGYAYVLKTNPDYLPDTTKKFEIQDKLSLNNQRFENNLEKLTSPRSYLDPFKINSSFVNKKNSVISPNGDHWDLKNRNLWVYGRDFPDRIWKTAEQMRVEMRNNPEIMSWANLHNVDLGYKEPGERDDFFAPKIPESIYANRLVEAGLPVNRPDYSYNPMETYIVQDPSKFNLAGYFPMNSIMKGAEQKVLNKSGKEKLDYNNDDEHFEKESYIKDAMAKKMGLDPSVFNNGEYLIHYNKTPITEYTPGKKYGGWLDEFQVGGWANFVPASSTPLLRKDVSGNAGYRDNTRVNTINPATKKAAEAAQYARRVGSISQGKTKSDYEKAREASSFVSQAERRKGSADPLDYALDIFNPAAIGFAGVDLINNLGSATSNTVQGNFAEAGSDLLGAGLNALGVIPAAAAFKGIVKPLSKFARLTPGQYKVAQQFVNNPLNKTGQNFIKSLPEQINKAALSQINKNPRLALSLQRGRPISLDNVNTISGIRYGDVSSIPNFNKIRPNTVSEIDFFKQLEKGAGSLDNSLQKRVTDLESEEGFRRLVDQEKDYLFHNSDLEEGALERVAKINARARIDELKNTRNINKEAAEYASSNFLNTGIPNNFVGNSYLYDNAYRAAGYDDVLSNMLSKRQGLNLVKPTPNYSKSVPGEIGIGYNYVGNRPTEMHEIAHSLQRGRKLSVDDQLRNVIPKKELTRDQEHAYEYFREGSDGHEPSAFANELRESMLQSGIIPDYYSPISQQQIQDAYKYFKTKPMGTYDKNTGRFLSSTRILDFMAPNQSNSKLLSNILNKLPAVAPLGVGAAAASQLSKQKNGGWLDTYQDGGENLPELNSKIDIANFYKNPLSEKYAIYQDPTDKGYKYYLKSAEEPNIPSKTFDFTNLGNIARRIDKKEITTPQPIKYNSKMIDYAADQDYLTALATEEFPIIPPSFKDVLSNIPKLETINTIPKPKALPNKQPAVNNAFTFDSNYWNSADVQTEVFNRQLKDNKWYGEFDKRGDNVLNRTDVKRNYDSEVFLQNLATPNSVVIDIGSALGNNNPKLAGVSVYELASNPKIKSKNIKVIATDIPSEVKGFEELKRRGNSVYPIDYAQVPETFNTPVRDILKAKNLENVKDVYLRAANSIDLLMNVQETSEHFKHISSTLKDKNVTYLYNNTILYKPAGSTKFKKLGNLNNSAFDHRSPSWKNNPNRNHYTLLPTNKTGGEISWLNKYK